MFHIKVSLFARTKSLENKIDLFHDKIIDAAMTFKKAIRVFLNEKRSENYRKLSKQIKTIEHDADALRRDIENKLYIQNLIHAGSHFRFRAAAGQQTAAGFADYRSRRYCRHRRRLCRRTADFHH